MNVDNTQFIQQVNNCKNLSDLEITLVKYKPNPDKLLWKLDYNITIKELRKLVSEAIGVYDVDNSITNNILLISIKKIVAAKVNNSPSKNNYLLSGLLKTNKIFSESIINGCIDVVECARNSIGEGKITFNRITIYDKTKMEKVINRSNKNKKEGL